ncbi:MAG: formylglycine-generating enzyme family protein [Acidobacteria bacterium]|nr:formylglycine-generating enzyme family protein [Acidobacteriota bacterium]
MGSPRAEPHHRADEEQVEVTITRGFWMGQYEVTQGEWQRVSGAFPQPQDKGVGARFPVHWVSFREAEEFCLQLNAAGRQSREIPKGWSFRLPAEAEWEYACRAGTTTATAFGDSLSVAQANFASAPYNGATPGPALMRASEVGSYPANAWGLHDMHGNVWEYCRDWYHARLPGGTDPDLYAVKGQQNRDGTHSRVRRGGAWIEEGWTCRPAMRLRYEPERRSDHIGFRVVLART